MDLNVTRAYKVAYKNIKKDETARANSSRLLTNANIKSYINKRMKDIQKEIELLQQEKENRINEKELINKVMELLEYDENKLVELRYFSKPTKSWTSIAQELNQSVDNCIKVRRKIISRIAELLF